MATRMQQRRGTAAQWISTNAGLGPVLNAGEIGWESDTNKFKVGDGTNNWANLDYFADINSTVNPAFGSSITFEGATADSYETVLQVTDPTADRTITLPNATGTVITTGNLSDITDIGVFTGSITIEGTTADGFETTLAVTDPTADRTITFPNATGTVVLKDTEDTLTNKTLTAPTISGLQLSDGAIYVEGATANDYETTLQFTDPTADRTVTIPDATDTLVGRATTDTLTNKSISLGSNTVTSTLAQLNTAVSDADVASLAGTETLTNKSISLASNTVTSTLAQLNTAISDADVATLAGTETLTNKTLTSPTLTTPTISGTGDLLINGDTNVRIVPAAGSNAYVGSSSADNVITTAGNTQTLTNKTLTSPTLTTPNIGVATGTSLTLSGDLTINGTTTTINSTTLAVDDKNIVIGDVATPSDATADGGGITLKGATDKTFNWVDATDAWTSSEHVNLASGKAFYLNGTLETAAAQTLTNKTISGVDNTLTVRIANDVSGLGTGVATFLGTPSSANLASAVTDETGTGGLVFATAPTLTNAVAVNPVLRGPEERWSVSATAATGTIPLDVLTSGILYYTTNASANWTLNIRGDGSTSLNDSLATNDSITVVFFVTNGATPYYQTGFQIDGSAVTPKWQNGTAPSAGNASSIDIYSYTIVKTGSAAFTAFGSQTKFA